MKMIMPIARPATVSVTQVELEPMAGQARSIRTRMTKAATSSYAGERYAPVSCVDTPTTSPPTIAPYGWPTPPSTAAAIM